MSIIICWKWCFMWDLQLILTNTLERLWWISKRSECVRHNTRVCGEQLLDVSSCSPFHRCDLIGQLGDCPMQGEVSLRVWFLQYTGHTCTVEETFNQLFPLCVSLLMHFDQRWFLRRSSIPNISPVAFLVFEIWPFFVHNSKHTFWSIIAKFWSSQAAKLLKHSSRSTAKYTSCCRSRETKKNCLVFFFATWNFKNFSTLQC